MVNALILNDPWTGPRTSGCRHHLLSIAPSPTHGHLPQAPCPVTETQEQKFQLCLPSQASRPEGGDGGSRNLGHLFHDPKPLGGPCHPGRHWVSLPQVSQPPCRSEDQLGSLSFRKMTQRGGRSALGPRLQKWVTKGEKVVKKRQNLFLEAGLSADWELSVP